MRLAVVSPFVDRRHGTERALAELLERLALTYRCEVHLYSERVEDLPLTDRREAPGTAPGSIVWHQVPAFPGPQLLRFPLWMAANTCMRRFDRAFRGLECDLVLSPGINCLDADVIIVHALFHRLRELSAGQAPSQDVHFLRRLHRRAYYALLSALERHIYPNQRVQIATVSQRTAVLLAKHFRRNDIRIIRNGVDVRQFSTAKRLALRAEQRARRGVLENDLVVLLVGNDWRVKGVPALLAALAAAPGVFLLVAGEDNAKPFQDLAHRLGVAERCRWEKPRANAIDFYAAGDVYASPSLEDSFGLPVAEAMACGLPVITSSFAGVSGLIRDGVEGFVLPDPNDVQTLAGLLATLQRDPLLRQRVGDTAAMAAQRWTWDQSAAETWELLQQFAKIRGSQTRAAPAGAS